MTNASPPRAHTPDASTPDRGTPDASAANPITAETIASAETLLGVRYTDAERAQMLDNLEDQILLARARRGVALGNEAPMASRFDPRLPGTVVPADGAVHWSPVSAPCPAADEDIAFATAAELSAWLASGALTSRRLTDIYLARIAALDPTLFCWATVAADRARADAEAADREIASGRRRGPLHGIPYGMKDIVDTAGIETAWGAEPYQDRVPERDAAVTRKLREAGAVLLGKTTVGALAFGDIWYGGRTRNPWNPNEGSGGSSAGSASAVAAGLCGFAIGTETLGSIVNPSQRCGTTGLRPTFGRVSRAGAMTLCGSLDKIGPICRGVEDTAMVLAAINGFDPDDRGSIAAPFAFDPAAPIAGMRVGYLPAAYGAGANAVDHAALATVRGLGLEVVPVELPDLPYRSLMHVLSAEAAAFFEELTLSDRDDLLTWQEPHAWPNTFRKARFLSAVDHVQLDRLRYQVMLALDEVFRSVDVMVGPYGTGPMLVASNFTGHPCLHLRAGFLEIGTRLPVPFAKRLAGVTEMVEDGPTHRVPSGISIWGRLFDEARVVRFGMVLEEALAVRGERPKLGNDVR